jgi:hypothetical protein
MPLGNSLGGETALEKADGNKRGDGNPVQAAHVVQNMLWHWYFKLLVSLFIQGFTMEAQNVHI